MLSCSERRALAVWPVIILALCAGAPGQEVRPRSILRGPRSPVYCLTVSADGKSLASGTRDGRVVRWDVGGATAVVAPLPIGDDANGFTQVLSVAFSPDGKTLASGGWDRAVRSGTRRPGPEVTLAHENLVYSVAFSPDGRTLASGEHQIGAIRLWEVETGKSAGVLESGRGSVWSAAFSPDGNALASGGYIVRRRGRGGAALGSFEPGREVGDPGPAGRARSPSRPMGGCWRARVHHEGRRPCDRRSGAALGRADRRVAADMDVARTAGRAWCRRLFARRAAGRRGRAVGERAKERKAGEIHLWDVASDRLVWSQSCHDDDVTCLAFTPDGRFLASGGRDKVVKLWDIAELMRHPSR